MEVHGYTENGSINATIDGKRWSIPDVPGNRFRQMIAEWEAEGNTIPPYVPPPPGPYRLYKSVFILRMTPEEAVTMEGVLANADARMRLLFNSVEYFVSDDPFFTTLKTTVAGALGQTRADELLAPDVT